MNDWLPPVQALRAFVATVRSGSFLRAGERLGLSHSAVSHHVGQLEHLVGTALFSRHRRGAVPTPAAERLAERVTRALDELREALAEARSDARRSVSLTLTPALAQRWLIPRLAKLQELHPGLDIRIKPTAQVLDLDVEDVDVAFRYGAGNWNGTNAVHISDEWIFPVASPHYRHGRLPKHPAQLSEHTLIRNPRQDWSPWLNAAGAKNVRPKGPVVDDAGLALDLAVRGDGIALARSVLAHADIQSGRLRPLFDLATRDRFAYWLVVRPGREKNPGVMALVDWIRSECLKVAGPKKKTVNDRVP